LYRVLAIEKLNPMIRPSGVKVADTTTPKSSRSASSASRRRLRKETPMRAESYSTTGENTKTKSGYLNIGIMEGNSKCVRFRSQQMRDYSFWRWRPRFIHPGQAPRRNRT
jgi:hypothetical protein